MMKLFLILFLPLQVLALSFEVIGPCSERSIYQTATTIHNTSLGFLTEYMLKKSNLSFVGDKNGIKSIDKSPVGDEALEVLSDNTMRSYGWCVEVDGYQPDVMPDKVMISASVQQIKWFYAFSLYESGQWTQYCVPSYTVRSKQICKE